MSPPWETFRGESGLAGGAARPILTRYTLANTSCGKLYGVT